MSCIKNRAFKGAARAGLDCLRGAAFDSSGVGDGELSRQYRHLGRLVGEPMDAAHPLFSVFLSAGALGCLLRVGMALEHSDHNFNSYLTMPVSRLNLYLAKLLPAVGVSIFTQVLVGVYFVVSGKLVGMTAAVPWAQLANWLLCGALGSIAICAVQLFLSLWLCSFAIPVALALIGGIIGLLFTSQGWGIYFPYALLSLGMRANNPDLVLELPQFILSTAFYTLLFAALIIRLLKKRDVSGE